jgi:hypothetical protein
MHQVIDRHIVTQAVGLFEWVIAHATQAHDIEFGMTRPA